MFASEEGDTECMNVESEYLRVREDLCMKLLRSDKQTSILL